MDHLSGNGKTSSPLERQALVLNRSWLPIHVTTVRRALTLVYRRAAFAVRVDTYETFDFDCWVAKSQEIKGPCLQGVRVRVPIPEVIVLAQFDRLPRKYVPFSRRNLYRRDQHRCQYCGRNPGMRHLTIDHIVPRSVGGLTSWTNCVLACAGCNGRKGNQTPRQAGMRLLRQPERPDWCSAIDTRARDFQRLLSRFSRYDSSVNSLE
jgi:5-methylcytosine-specific restriction endonuclease McrA